MSYDAPINLGLGQLQSFELIALAAIVPAALAIMIGLKRETAVITGIVCAVTMAALP